ncbi:hypothetical protein [Corynebacterium glutamicum]|uniref:Uncharacterized protein n=1 Tax=Corynebacterium glutamicum (strain R) TaxID=340322 RepID=A0AB72V944_CORGB|nr:hypothetical protein [Corynebacterium glutamicum]BAF53791.1 hypothetical protein cgR_0819 [Corynebacterium glutamicum R]
MKDTTEINWQGYADGTAIREAVIHSIEREVSAGEQPTPNELEFLGLFQHRAGYVGSLITG